MFLQILCLNLCSQVGQIITDYGPDLLTSCGSPQNILSVGTTYVVGIGGPCSAYDWWTPYSQYPTEHLQALSNGCNTISASVTVTPSSTSVTVTPSSTPVTTTSSPIVNAISSVDRRSLSQVDDNGSGAKCGFPSFLMIPMTAIMYVLYFL